MTVAELERQIKERFGLSVNVKTLYRLTQAAAVQRADLEIAGATASILGVGLDDLFTIEAYSDSDDGEADMPILGPADSRRMAALVDRQAQRLLTDEEWAELEKLVATYGRLLHERRVREVARKQGRPFEDVRREMVGFQGGDTGVHRCPPTSLARSGHCDALLLHSIAVLSSMKPRPCKLRCR